MATARPSQLAASVTAETAAKAVTESSEAAVVKEKLWPACHERQAVREKSITHLLIMSVLRSC